MSNNLFLLDFNESLESYIFDLIQSIKINKFDLLINDMTITLVDHDKQFVRQRDLFTWNCVVKDNKIALYRW